MVGVDSIASFMAIVMGSSLVDFMGAARFVAQINSKSVVYKTDYWLLRSYYCFAKMRWVDQEILMLEIRNP